MKPVETLHLYRWLIKYITIFIFFTSIGCNHKNNITNLRIDNSNSLRAEFNFNIHKECQSFIEFWTADDSIRYRSSKSEASLNHRISLLKLKPSTEYHYIIYVEDKKRVLESLNGTFVTDSLPDNLPAVNLVSENENVFSGYILIRNVQDPGQQILLDNKGEVVWYHVFDTILFRPFSWTNAETIIALKNEFEIHEIDLTGKMLLNLNLRNSGLSESLHHEIIKDDQGNIYSLTRNNQVFDLSGIGGGKADTIKGDGIIVLDSRGHKKWVWDIFQFTDPLKDPNLLETKEDWSHANSLNFDQDGHFLVSFRHFNQVWKINSENGEIIWKLGLHGDFSLPGNQIFYLQHTAHINSDGDLMLFDNGGPERMTSRAVSFSIHDNDKREIALKINAYLPKSLFSFKQGSAYLIEEDKILFCSSIRKSILVTDLNGQILWKLDLSESIYRADYIEEINWGKMKVKNVINQL